MTMDAATVCDRVAAGHAEMLLLCDQLETVADGLPEDFDRGISSALVQALSEPIAAAQAYEEMAMFPLLLTGPVSHEEMLPILAELHREHQTDLFQAEDVQDMLRSYADGRPNMPHDAAGFMLRALFEGLKRHIWLEQTLLLPLIRHKRPLPVME